MFKRIDDRMGYLILFTIMVSMLMFLFVVTQPIYWNVLLLIVLSLAFYWYVLPIVEANVPDIVTKIITGIGVFVQISIIYILLKNIEGMHAIGKIFVATFFPIILYVCHKVEQDKKASQQVEVLNDMLHAQQIEKTPGNFVTNHVLENAKKTMVQFMFADKKGREYMPIPYNFEQKIICYFDEAAITIYRKAFLWKKRGLIAGKILYVEIDTIQFQVRKKMRTFRGLPSFFYALEIVITKKNGEIYYFETPSIRTYFFITKKMEKTHIKIKNPFNIDGAKDLKADAKLAYFDEQTKRLGIDEVVNTPTPLRTKDE